MDILQVSPKYYPSVGGVEYTVQKLAEGMMARGHKVTVVCGNPYDGKVKTEEVNEIEVLRVPTYSPRNAFHLPRNREVIKNFLKKDIDIVHTHSVHAVISTLPLTLKKSMNPKWKLVYTMHFSTLGYTFFRRLLWKILWKRRINSGLKYVDAIHFSSVLESNVIMEKFSNAKGKLWFIPWGIDGDVSRYNWRGQNSNYVLYCGRLEKYKRIDLAVRSIEHVRRLGYDVRFLMVGRGSKSRCFGKLAAQTNWITCMHPKSREEYLELLSNARAVINLSSAENFNLFLAEACAIGVPIVATPEAAAFCPEFANVNDLSSKAVAHVIAKAISNSNSCIFPKTCAPAPWTDIVKRFETLYVKALDAEAGSD